MSDSIAKMHEQIDDITSEISQLVFNLTEQEYSPSYYTAEQVLIGKTVYIDLGNRSVLAISKKPIVITDSKIVLSDGSFSLGYFIYYHVLTN